MERSRKVKIFLSFLVFLLISGGAVFSFLNYSPDKDTNDEVLGNQDLYSVPRITSLAPISVYEGEEYIYMVKVTDNDTEMEDIAINLLEGPSWLGVSGLKISGTAPFGSVGTYRLVIRVSDGDNSSVQESYILVEGRNE
ncbi:MAG TPA: Ig domain-containing protein [Candidatus Dojkabacteria bacterium]|nr:Ig domain-containing protein [Candidatus Dojkabacteria bacterium]